MYRTIAILLMAETLLLPQVKQSSTMTPLKEVKEIQILPIVVSDPDKVKSPDATALVERSLRRAVLANEIQVVGSAPFKVRVSLDEFSGGSFAKRFVVGFGSGRSTVDSVFNSWTKRIERFPALGFAFEAVSPGAAIKAIRPRPRRRQTSLTKHL